MADVKFTLDRSRPPKLSKATQSRMAQMTPADIEAGAAGDAENPPLTPEEANRLVKARFVRSAREATGLVQEVFAREFRISPGRLRDLEQGRTEPDTAFLAYMAVIKLNPNYVRSTLIGTFGEAGELPS